jgi:hypothetical protein
VPARASACGPDTRSTARSLLPCGRSPRHDGVAEHAVRHAGRRAARWRTAAWKLKPPIGPSTSSSSPQTNSPGQHAALHRRGSTSSSATPPRVTSACAKPRLFGTGTTRSFTAVSRARRARATTSPASDCPRPVRRAPRATVRAGGRAAASRRGAPRARRRRQPLGFEQVGTLRPAGSRSARPPPLASSTSPARSIGAGPDSPRCVNRIGRRARCTRTPRRASSTASATSCTTMPCSERTQPASTSSGASAGPSG